MVNLIRVEFRGRALLAQRFQRTVGLTSHFLDRLVCDSRQR